MVRRAPILGLLVLCSASAQASDQKTIVAVLDIHVDGVGGFDEPKIARFTSILDNTVVSAGFETTPRSVLERERIHREKLASYDPCRDDDCQIELGRAVSASKLLRTVWRSLGDDCELSLEVIDLAKETKEMVINAPRTRCTDKGLGVSIREAGIRLRSKASGGYGDFALELAAASEIKNPPADEKGYLRIAARCKNRPDERVSVYVNGAAQGEVYGGHPYIDELPVGRYVILLRAVSGLYLHKRFDVQMTPSGLRIPEDGEVELLPVFGGLVIAGKPPAATAMIDGQPTPIRRGEGRVQLKGGKHVVRLDAAQHLGREYEVEIVPGEVARLDYDLQRRVGYLDIASDVSGAEVRVDGRRVGIAPMKFEVPTGTHEVVVAAPGHHPHKVLPTIRLAETTRIDARLQPKWGRLKIEAVAPLDDGPVQLEVELELDGRIVGMTPWKGRALAEVPHQIRLKAGSATTPARAVRVEEGEEQTEIIKTPIKWAGRTAGLRFDLVDGPWKAKFGQVDLDLRRVNQLRPGKVAVDLFLENDKVAERRIMLSPGRVATIEINERPRTPTELEAATTFWTIRKWSAVGATAVLGIVGAERLAAAHRAEGRRDEAVSALSRAADAFDYAAHQGDIAAAEDDRISAQRSASAILISGAIVGAWALVEWLFLEPERGELQGPELIPVGGGP